jgi:hypothetical protein
MNDDHDNAQTDKEALARYGEGLTHAWTVRQPFALAVATGIKPIENKKERPPLALMGKLIGIHAGLQWAQAENLRFWAPGVAMPRPDDPRLTYGALVGVARLVGVVRQTPWVHGKPDGHPTRAHVYTLMQGKSVGVELPKATALRIEPWWRGPWGWLLEEAVLLPEPIPMRGQQGLWRISGSFSGPSYDEEVGAWPMTYAAWALEQWRKAREGA